MTNTLEDLYKKEEMLCKEGNYKEASLIRLEISKTIKNMGVKF